MTDPAADVAVYLLGSQGWQGAAPPTVDNAALEDLTRQYLVGSSFTQDDAIEFAKHGIVSPGAVAGAGFPVVVTDSSGVTDLSGNPWNVSGSGDRLIP